MQNRDAIHAARVSKGCKETDSRGLLAGETDLKRLVKRAVFGIGARTTKFGHLLPPERLAVGSRVTGAFDWLFCWHVPLK